MMSEGCSEWTSDHMKVVERIGGLGLVLAVTVAACGGNGGTQSTAGQVTFWQDVAPIYNDRCVKCHQQGGIAPFRLDDYADAKAYAPLELARVNAGTMPPYFMVHDGSCGDFQDDGTLAAAEKAQIAAWVAGGLVEGTPVTLTPPAQPALDGALDVTTPSYAPVPQGGALAAFDEYRCFLLDPPNAADAFLTGYAVSPGDPSIVHHAIVFVVDPQAQGNNGQTNAQVMDALHAASPDRPGWPCFGAAGDNVSVGAVPVTWAPGQGVVSYPDGMGVSIRATDKLVVQVHYNLADPASAGKIDSTTVHLRFVPQVSRRLVFLLPDLFLDSLRNGTPDSLPPGQADAPYTWTRTGVQLGLGGVPSADLVAVMPHMHGRGIRQYLRIGSGGAAPACAAHLESWSFHWQEFYFYRTRPVITPGTTIQVTCEYDTSLDTMPVLPGWGTRNEMCLTVLMVALPPS
jgi:hypothetical protein